MDLEEAQFFKETGSRTRSKPISLWHFLSTEGFNVKVKFLFGILGHTFWIVYEL
jgi:hypothetical protein